MPSSRALALLLFCSACSTRPASLVEPSSPDPTAEARFEGSPDERIVYMVITDRFKNGDPSNDGPQTDPSGLLTFHGGDFQGLTQSLDYLQDLGVNTLWVTPIVEQIPHPVDWEGQPHWGYHGYWTENFDRLEPRLGTPDDLRSMLDAAHQHGLDVLLDVVLNHAGYRSHFADDRQWTRECQDEWTNDLTQCLFGLPDFLTEDPIVAAQLIDWQEAWFRDYPFDGLRADTVKHVEVEVWRQFLAAIRTETADDPDFFTLGESWGTAPAADEPLLAAGLFDAMYDFEFDGLVEGYLNGRMRAEALAHHLGVRNDLAIGRYVHYLNTHDTALMTGRLENPEAYPLALVLLLSSAGIPLLYYGDEVGRPGGAWPDNRPDMPWVLTEDAEATLALTRDLIAVRRAHPALSRGSLEEIQAAHGLVVFGRSDGADRLVVALNRGPDPASIPCPDATACEPLLCHRCRSEGGQVALDPFGAAILLGGSPAASEGSR